LTFNLYQCSVWHLAFAQWWFHFRRRRFWWSSRIVPRDLAIAWAKVRMESWRMSSIPLWTTIVLEKALGKAKRGMHRL